MKRFTCRFVLNVFTGLAVSIYMQLAIFFSAQFTDCKYFSAVHTTLLTKLMSCEIYGKLIENCLYCIWKGDIFPQHSVIHSCQITLANAFCHVCVCDYPSTFQISMKSFWFHHWVTGQCGEYVFCVLRINSANVFDKIFFLSFT